MGSVWLLEPVNDREIYCVNDEVSMNRPVIVSISAASFLAGAAMFSAVAPVSAQSNDVRFECGTSRGAPATMVTTPRGTMPVIRWVSYAFGGDYTPDYRCKVVSPKFQQYYKEGKLNYLTTGYANNQPIVCVTKDKGGPCIGVLFTLKANSDPWQTLTRLMNVRVQAAGPLNESTGGGSPAGTDRYIDMNEYLRTAPIESAVAPAAAPVAPATTEPILTLPSAPAPSKGLW
jgi:hypothetical protein